MYLCLNKSTSHRQLVLQYCDQSISPSMHYLNLASAVFDKHSEDIELEETIYYFDVTTNKDIKAGND